jgi:hypothetical protein
MAGQSSQLSLKEARAMQMRVQHSGSHANSNGGKGGKMKSMSSEGSHRKMRKEKMMEDCK